MNLANKMFQVACERVYINNKHHFSSGGIGSINCSNVERVGSSAGRHGAPTRASLPRLATAETSQYFSAPLERSTIVAYLGV